MSYLLDTNSVHATTIELHQGLGIPDGQEDGR